MTGHNMRAGRRQLFQPRVTAQCLRHIDGDRERLPPLEVFVVMRGIRGQDDGTRMRLYPHTLKPLRVARNRVHRNSGSDFAVTIVEPHPSRIDLPHQTADVIGMIRLLQRRLAHARASGVCHFPLLNVKMCRWKTVEGSGVVEMQMREDDRVERVRIDAESAQCVDRLDLDWPVAPDAFCSVIARIDKDRPIGIADYPYIEIQRLRAGVIVRPEEICSPRAFGMAGIFYGENFVGLGNRNVPRRRTGVKRPTSQQRAPMSTAMPS